MADDKSRNENESTDLPQPRSEIPDVSISLDALLELLAHHHRREILRLLSADPNHTATVDEIVARLTAHEATRTGERPERDKIEMDLNHTHLPKLTASGLLEYDTRSKQLRYWPHDQLEALLADLQSYEPEQ